jgi:hypothetical protein
VTDRDQVERDLEQFSALAPTLGLDAGVEIFDPRLQAATRVSMEDAGSWWLPPEPIGEPLFAGSFESAGFRLVDVTARYRRNRIRAAARARKDRRGWR